MSSLDRIIKKVHKSVELSAADWRELREVCDLDSGFDEDLEISAVDISKETIENYYYDQEDFSELTRLEEGFVDAYCRARYIERGYDTIRCLKIQGSDAKYIWFAADYYYDEYDVDYSIYSDYQTLKQSFESLRFCFIEAYICNKRKIYELTEEINPKKMYLSSNSGECIYFKDWAKNTQQEEV